MIPNGRYAGFAPVSVGYSTNADSSSVQVHRITTLRRCPWPRSIRRWWRWPLSAVDERSPARRPAEDREREVEDRHPEDQQRDRERSEEEVRLADELLVERVGAAADDARRDGEQQPEQQRAAVAHEDPRRVEVVRQEPDAHADGDDRHERADVPDVEHVAVDQLLAVEEERAGTDRHDAGRQAVEAVDEVDRVWSSRAATAPSRAGASPARAGSVRRRTAPGTRTSSRRTARARVRRARCRPPWPAATGRGCRR